jgi:hypothetical protein
MRFSLQNAFDVLDDFMNSRVSTTDEDRNSVLLSILLDIFECEDSGIAFFGRMLYFRYDKRQKFINKPSYMLAYEVWSLLFPSIRVGDDEHQDWLEACNERQRSMLGPLRRAGFVIYRAMATLPTNSAPPFKPFRLALVQMGGVTSSKEKNLVHAKELIVRAASPGDGAKPGVIVLPVGSSLIFI